MPQERYTLDILKQTFTVEVDRTVFDSKSFTALPSDGNSPLKTREERKNAQVHVPLTELDLELNGHAKRIFTEMRNVFENGKIRFELPSGEKVTIAELRKAAKLSRDSEQSLLQGFESYTQKQFGRSYSVLISEAQKSMITRFQEAFDNTGPLPPMQMTPEEHVTMRENFTHYPIWTSPENLREFRELADQGHVYSQYLAGVLLATVAGEFSADCVKYLVAAYQNKVPDAMAALAEFCFMHRDYLGAAQCALLSVDGGHRDSKRLIQKSYGIMGMQVYQTANGMVFGSQVLTKALHESGFGPVIERVYKDVGGDSLI